MAKFDSSNPNGGPSYQAPRYRPNWILAIVTFVAGSYLLAALISYDPNQVTFRTTSLVSKNWVGYFGADAVWVFNYSIGGSTWMLMVALFWMCWVSIRNSRHLVATRLVAIAIGLMAFSALLAMFSGLLSNFDSLKASELYPKAVGGWIGAFIYRRLLAEALGPFGSGLLLGAIYCSALLFVCTRDIGSEIEKMLTNFTQWRAERAKAKSDLAKERAHGARTGPSGGRRCRRCQFRRSRPPRRRPPFP